MGRDGDPRSKEDKNSQWTVVISIVNFFTTCLKRNRSDDFNIFVLERFFPINDQDAVIVLKTVLYRTSLKNLHVRVSGEMTIQGKCALMRWKYTIAIYFIA
jgi:hypothetical protein